MLEDDHALILGLKVDLFSTCSLSLFYSTDLFLESSVDVLDRHVEVIGIKLLVKNLWLHNVGLVQP